MTRANNNGYTEEELKEINRIKRFLVENDFKFTTVEVLDALAKLIYKSTITPNLVMNKEYEELAATGTKNDTFRLRLGYYVKQNYDKVKESICGKYGYNIGEGFIGVKNFVEQMAIVYSIYY